MKRAVSKAATFILLVIPTAEPSLYAQNGIEQTQVNLEKEPSSVQPQWLSCDIDWMFSEIETGYDFSIRLSYKKSPIANQNVILNRRGLDSATADDRFVAEDQTDAQGVVRFFDIPPGHYEASIDGLLGPSSEIWVTDKATAKVEVRMEWPAKVTAVQNLQGSFGVNEGEVSPLASASLEVIELRAGMPIADGFTDPNGYYSFPGLRPGLYLLRANFPADGKMQAATYDMAVDLNPHAEDEELPYIALWRNECAGVEDPLGQESEKVMFDRALNEFKHKQFEFARLTLETLTNYPDSVYTRKAEDLLRDPRIHDCEIVWSNQSCKAGDDPGRALFDGASRAIELQHFDVAHLTLQTLVNSYPNSKYAFKARELLEDQRIGNCENVWSKPSCVDSRPGSTR